MKTIFPVLLIVIATACQSELKKDRKSEKIIEPKQITNADYKLVAENLFKDKNGNIYFRTIDRSSINDDREVKASYLINLRYDTIIDNKLSYVEKELENVIDPITFKKVGKEGLTTYYQDKNHKYFHLETADGGTLHCTK